MITGTTSRQATRKTKAASKTDRRIVLDVSALLAWLFHEKGAEVVESLLSHAVIPLPNLAEVLVTAAAREIRMSSEALRECIIAYGVKVEPPAIGDELRAAELIADTRARRVELGGTLSLGDGLCIAVAERLKLPVASGDQLWSQLTLKVAFHFFR